MTSEELKTLLQNTDTDLQNIESVLPPDVDDKIVVVLKNIQENTFMKNLILSFLLTVIPDYTIEKLTDALSKTIESIGFLKDAQNKGQIDKIRNICQNLPNHPVLLYGIAALLN